MISCVAIQNESRAPENLLIQYAKTGLQINMRKRLIFYIISLPNPIELPLIRIVIW